MTALKKAVTDEQLGALYRRTREFSDRVEKGVIPFATAMDHLQAAFAPGFSTGAGTRKIISFAKAEKILGADKVIEPSNFTKWCLSEMNLPIRYREQTLRAEDESNKKGETDFCLVYFPGDMSLIRQREIRGLDSKKPPYFDSGNYWWLGAEEKKCQEKGMAYWPKISSPAGFYLIDFKPRFADMNWQTQEAEISELGGQYERTPEDVFLFAAQSIYMLTSKNITSVWWHWGKILDSDGYRVSVALFDDGEAHVFADPLDCSGGSLRVSVSRKFDF